MLYPHNNCSWPISGRFSSASYGGTVFAGRAIFHMQAMSGLFRFGRMQKNNLVMDANPGKPETDNLRFDRNGHSGVGYDSRKSEGAWLDRSTAIAIRVSMALKARNLMQKELAEMLGIKPQQVSRILKGNVNLTLETISRLESALDIGLLEVPVDMIGTTSALGTNKDGMEGASTRQYL